MLPSDSRTKLAYPARVENQARQNTPVGIDGRSLTPVCRGVSRVAWSLRAIRRRASGIRIWRPSRVRWFAVPSIRSFHRDPADRIIVSTGRARDIQLRHFSKGAFRFQRWLDSVQSGFRHPDASICLHHDVRTRTAVTLDPDVDRMLKEEMRPSGTSFREALNRAVRRGLADSVATQRKAFKLRPRRLSLRLGIDPAMVRE
jgi:hypothetical protein